MYNLLINIEFHKENNEEVIYTYIIIDQHQPPE